jgi:phosphatidylglycerol:prolipoprotein diacylglycerol transferase
VLPELFSIPFLGWPVYSYGVMLGLSCVLGAHLAVYLAERSGISSKTAWWWVLVVIVVGVASGRVHELIVQGRLFSSEALEVSHSGRTAYGGFIGGVLSGILAARFLGVSFWRLADAAAPTLALGLGITRVGCFMYGCDYGFRSDAWGLSFPPGSPACRDQLDAGLLQALADGSFPASLPVFPAQLLASLVGWLLFGLCLWVWFRRPRREGTVLLVFALAYGLARAGLEALREDMGRGQLMGMTTSTTIGFGTAAVSLALLFVPKLRNLRPDAGEVLDVPSEDPAPEPKASKGKKKKRKR